MKTMGQRNIAWTVPFGSKGDIRKLDHGEVSLHTMSPGNGAEYRILIVGPNDFELGVLGRVERGYLVVTGDGRCHLFSGEGVLSMDYVQRKLDLNGGNGMIWYTQLIARALGREAHIPKEFLEDAEAACRG